MRFAPVMSLEPGMILGKDIVNTRHNFMLKKGVALTDAYIQFLREKGYIGAYIVDEATKDIVVEDPISSTTLYAGVEAVESGKVDDIIKVATNIVSEVSALEHLSVDLLDLRSFDDYTYHHSVNVAVYAVAVGKYMGLADNNLTMLCQAGICHDLGKNRIPLSILNKPGRLTDEEFETIKSHPQMSYDILYNNPEISALVRQAVLCHHENENGSGYPLGKEGKQIPLLAKIIHAVDVYDALTSKRPYKDPYAPVDAFDYLVGGCGILFDQSVVEAMQHVIPMYPPGVDVLLSNGENAVVVSQTSDFRRPIVRIIEKKIDVNLKTDEKYKEVFIASSGILPLDYVGTITELNESRLKAPTKLATILIVDDSVISLKQTEAALKSDKYKILTLQSGTAAINYIRAKGKPDVLIIDIDMPVMNGIATVKSLRSQGLAGYPIIFLTAMSSAEVVLKCRDAGCADYIVKPAKPTYIKERVAFALDRNEER